MTPMPWFRVYSDILTDRKLNRICKRTGQSKALVIGLWISLLALANESPDRGYLKISSDMPYTLDDLEDETGLPHEIINNLLDEFRSHGMINGKTTIEITNWSKRQYKSDNVTERVRKHRDVTLLKRSQTVIDTDTDTDTESESDTEAEHAAAANIFQLYENNIGVMTKVMADKLKSAEQDYPLTWFEPAITIAVEHNARNWRYVQAILERWKTQGFPDDGKKKPKSIEEQLKEAGYTSV